MWFEQLTDSIEHSPAQVRANLGVVLVSYNGPLPAAGELAGMNHR